MHGRHDGLYSGGKVIVSSSSSAPTRQLGSSRRRSWPKRSYAVARAKAAPWRTPLRVTILTQAGMAPQMVVKQDTPCIHVIDGDEGHLSKSGKLLL